MYTFVYLLKVGFILEPPLVIAAFAHEMRHVFYNNTFIAGNVCSNKSI